MKTTPHGPLVVPFQPFEISDHTNTNIDFEKQLDTSRFQKENNEIDFEI